MRNVVATVLALTLLFSAADASALVSDREVLYVDGTLPNVKADTMGQLDTTVPDTLLFTAGDLQAAIPYKGIESVEYSRKLARRIGVIATIAVVAVLKRRQRKHFISIAYKDDVGTKQLARFEVSKHQAPVLMDILRARSPRAFIQDLGKQHVLHRE